MKTLYIDRKKSGYSEEEAYFARIDRELIKKIRQENTPSSESDDSISNVIEASDRFQNHSQAKAEEKKAA